MNKFCDICGRNTEHDGNICLDCNEENTRHAIDDMEDNLEQDLIEIFGGAW